MQKVHKGPWGELSGWFSAEVELGVIGIVVEAKARVADDLTKGDGEKEGSKHRALGHALVNWGWGCCWRYMTYMNLERAAPVRPRYSD